jgi:hypothetical protein
MSLSTELVLAAATGSTDGLGVVVDIPTSATMYVRCPTDSAGRVDWNIKCNRAHTVQLYRAASIVQSVTLDVSANTLANTETVVVNGLTFTAHTNTNVRASRQFAIDGIGTADAVELAAAINYGTALTVTACTIGATLLVTGVDKTIRTYTAAAAEDLSAREFINTNAAAAAASIVRCMARDATASGVTAALTDGAEVQLTNTLGTATTVSNASAQITATNYGVPGVTATPAAGVITIVPNASTKTYSAPVIQAATGTAAGHCVVASTTLTGLIRHGAPISYAADTTTAGYWLEQYCDHWPYSYIGITEGGVGAATTTVKATRYVA